MRRPRTLAARWAAALTAAVALLVPVSVGTAHAKPINPDHPLTVMTRNLYLGADIQRPLRAVAGLTDPNAIILALAHANAETREIVDQTSFPTRAGLLTKEIARTAPDVISLQEVALWRHGDLELNANLGVPNAEAVDYDYLKILLADLHAAGLNYYAASVQEESDVEAPSFSGSPAGADAQDVRLTMRDAVLVNADAHDVTVVDTGGGHYSPASTLTIPLAGKNMVFTRGYAWADLTVGAKRVRFIATHLEAFGSNFALGQAKELLAGPASKPGTTTIIACDCNSDPLNASLSNGVEHRAPYQWIVSHGFTDEWLQWKPANQGFTSGFSERVNDPDNSKIDHRIDMIFARTPSGKPLAVTAGQVTGTSPSDQDLSSGLWPSDHGGVVLTLSGKDG
jgi:endonuclease/exonuclease/phosphatase family metal-dependent hydrolase